MTPPRAAEPRPQARSARDGEAGLRGGDFLHAVLVHPEIPHNTGAIGRTCVALGCDLGLVRPLGFALSDEYVRRAGLDYWENTMPGPHARSLNLANAASIALYEAYRQIGGA